MKTLHCIITLAFIGGFFIKTNAQQTEKEKLAIIRQVIEKNSFIIENDKNKIPAAITAKIKSVTPTFSIANPNEEYEATDLISGKKIPTRQLIMLAKTKNHYIITYKQGGYALLHRVTYFKIKNNKVVDYWSGFILNNKGVLHNDKALSSLDLLKKELFAKNIGDSKHFSEF